jgi:hypothetical protein
MTPQERAAALYRALGDGCDLSAPEQEKRDIEAITDALTDTRRAALLEAAQVAITYGGRARDEDLSGSYTSELIVQALDRLAQEGCGWTL